MPSFQSALEEIVRRIEAGNTVLDVGFKSGAKYPEGESVAQVAWDNEYGDPKEGRVPRPFFRRMIASEKKNWGPQLAALLSRGDSVELAMNKLGGNIKEELEMSINEFTDPPLKPSTIAKKGFAKPLIETALMRNSVTYRTHE